MDNLFNLGKYFCIYCDYNNRALSTIRQTALSKKQTRQMKSSPRRRRAKKDFRVAQVSIMRNTQLETSALSLNQKDRLTRGFRTNTSIIQNKNNFGSHTSAHQNENMFRSEIVGVNESKLLMKKRVGNFSRLDRFRARNRNNKLGQKQIIKTGSRSKNKNIRGANSVFESLSKCRVYPL
jgi:hypothetical protein